MPDGNRAASALHLALEKEEGKNGGPACSSYSPGKTTVPGPPNKRSWRRTERHFSDFTYNWTRTMKCSRVDGFLIW